MVHWTVSWKTFKHGTRSAARVGTKKAADELVETLKRTKRLAIKVRRFK